MNVTANISGINTKRRQAQEGNRHALTVELRSGRRFLIGGSMLAMVMVAPSLAQAQQVAGGVDW